MALWREKTFEVNHHHAQELAVGPYPKLIAKLLSSRGFSSNEIESILNPKLSSLKDPLLILNMKKAVDRICEAYKKKQKICVYADFDLDGTSGLGILKLALKKLGFDQIAYYQPKRLKDGYGFHPHAVEELKLSGIDLIITVDVGITSHAAFVKAREVGVDVILTDHHLPSETLPDAYCVVNPNQKEDQSGLGYLCGAGVAFYLARALKRAFFEDPELPKNEWDLKELLDLFCIGTLTDMVPLVEDNRVLVKHGMVALQNTDKAGLKALLEALDLMGRPLSSQDISIKFAPKLNALSRMESDILPIHIYLEDNLQKARSLVEQILTNNQTRQTLQQDAETKALELLKSWSFEDFVFVVSDEFHRGVIGLIATKLSQEFNKPAFVGSKNSEGVVVGSGRLPNGHDSSLVEALGFAQSALTRFGGHSAAAGFEFHSQNENEVIEKINEFYKQLKMNPQQNHLDYDAEATLAEITSHFMKWYDHLGPYGVGFSIPVLKFNNLVITKLTELKGGHLKLQLCEQGATDQLQQDTFVDALLFSPQEKIKNELKVNHQYNLLAEVQWNYFRNKQTIQLLIKDFKKTNENS